MFENLLFCGVNKNMKIMKNLEFNKLTVAELSRLRGGEWIYVEGRWIWRTERAIDDPLEKQRDQMPNLNPAVR